MIRLGKGWEPITTIHYYIISAVGSLSEVKYVINDDTQGRVEADIYVISQQKEIKDVTNPS